MVNKLILGLLGSLFLSLSLAMPVQEKRSAAIPAAKHSFSLRRQMVPRAKMTLGSTFRNLRVLQGAADPQPAGIDTALAAHLQVEYLVNVTVANHNYSLIIDTGSSDTWFVKSGFQCLNGYRQRVPLIQCRFGPEFQGDFPGGQIKEQRFQVAYGDGVTGPYLNGDYGYANITVAGVTIPNQQIALATLGYWNGDGISSGILGLGMPGLTEAIISGGSGAGQSSTVNAIEYSPLVVTMSNNSDIAPMFSLGLSRDPAESFLALGGVPRNVEVGDWATTPLRKWTTTTGSEYLWYTMQPERFLWNNSDISQIDARPPPVIVDSGTTMNYLPPQIVQAIHSAYVPRAVYDPEQGSYFVNCDAVPPSFGVDINGTVLWTLPSSMILPEVKNSRGQCSTGFIDTTQQPYILGDVFMQGLVAVFELGDVNQMRFAKRI
ncbi:hypothetical protein VTK73DRAFT_7408 [Phialemonium thermophilum]|uniref:Peptidase A1 domain-containing protein n=1 Tax=Phialemonium thermophilum TaxID=223376 RepID=A0ABR3XU05_9PEZI